MPDEDNYPVQADLDALRHFDGTVEEYMAHLRGLWAYPNYWNEREEPSDFGGRLERVYEISTGGWSGNEMLISEIETDMPWMVWWWNHRRGGHYEVRIPLDMLKEKVLHVERHRR